MATAQQVHLVQTITDQFSPEKRSHQHVTRDRNGYFYFFSKNAIQRYDGDEIQDVNIQAIVDEGFTPEMINDVFYTNEGIIILIEEANKKYFIPSSSLQVKNERDVSPLNLTDLITGNTSSIIWGDSTVSKVEGSTSSILHQLPKKDIHFQYTRQDKVGNSIAVFSSSEYYLNDNKVFRHHDIIYVLDTAHVLHDFSRLTSLYSVPAPEGQTSNRIEDIYADDIFHRAILTGFSDVKVVTMEREGIDLMLHSKLTEKDRYGAIVSGVASNGTETLLSTNKGTFFNYNPENEKITRLFRNFKVNDSYLGQLKYYSDKKLFYQRERKLNGTSNINIIDLENQKIERHNVPYEIIDFQSLSNRRILIGGNVDNGGFIGLYYPLNKKIEKLKKDLPEVRSLFFDEKNKRYWIGTRKGLFVMNRNLELISIYSRSSQPNVSLSVKNQYIAHDDISAIKSYDNKLMILTLGAGVYIVDETSLDVEKNISEINNLTDNRVLGLEQDNDGNYWISTFNGLNVLDSNYNVIKRYYDFQGLPNNEFNFQSSCKDKAGNLYFGTINGACKITPHSVLRWKDTRHIVFESATSYNDGKQNTQKFENELELLESSDSIILSYNVADFIKLPYQKKVEFKTIPQGPTLKYDDEIIHISNFESGQYELETSNPDISNRTALTLKIKKDYSQLLKLLLGLILFLSLTLGGIYFWIKHFKKQEEAKTLLNQKVSELQLSALQSQMNPHFIFNALGSIQYFIQSSDLEKADEYLADFGKLMRGILESSKKKMISLNEEVKMLKLYTRLEQIRFENKFEVAFNINPDLDMEIMIPPMLIQPYVENAINHGLHHLESRKGKLQIDLNVSNTHDLMIKIKDNGIGRQASQNLNLNKSHRSRSMEIIADRIHTINRSSTSRIENTFTDLISDGQACGTIVTLIFKEYI